MNKKQLDPLKEIASIGAGNGATAISQLLKEEVTFQMPELELTQIEAVAERFGKKDQTVTVILNKLTGQFSGVVLFIFDPGVAKKIANILTEDAALADSALTEMVSVFLGNALKAVENFLGMRILHSVPAEATDMQGSLIDPVIAKLGEKTEEVLTISVKFKVKGLEFKSLLLADPQATKNMLSRLNNIVKSNGS